MATDVERLVLQMEANMRGFERAMDRAQRKANNTASGIERRFRRSDNQLSRTFRSMQSGAVRAFGAMGVAVSAVGFARLVQGSLDAAEAIADTSDRVGFAVEQLQELRFAADQNGSSARTLDMALQRFSRRVAEAAQGTGELRTTLEQYNIQLRNTDGSMRSSHEILLDYADALQGAESEQEQLRLAFKAFDSEGAQLVNLMRQGSAGIEEFSQRARDAGVVLEEGIVRQGAEANAQLRAMRQEIAGRVNSAVLENAENLIALADALGQVAEAAIAVASAFGGLFTDPIAGAIEEAAREVSFAPIDEEIRRLRAEIEALRDIQSPGSIGRIQEYERLINRLREARRELAQELASDLGDAPGATGGGGGGGGEAAKPDNALADYAARRQFEFEIKELARAREEEIQEKRQEAQDLGKEQARAYAEELANRREQFSQEFGRTFAAGMMSAFDGNLREFLTNQLRQAFYNAMTRVFEQLGERLFDALAGGGKGGGGFFGDVLGAVIGGGGKRLPGKAIGGPVRSGQGYVVGENGPELLVPSRAGTIIPQLPSMGATKSVTYAPSYTIDARGASVDAVAALNRKIDALRQEDVQTFGARVRAVLPGAYTEARRDGAL